MTDAPSTLTPGPAEDRGISPIASPWSGGRTGKAIVLAGLAAGCGAFALATSRHQAPAEKSPDTPAKQVVPFEPAPTLEHPGPDAPSLGAAATPAGPGAATAETPAAASQPSPLQAIRAAPILAYGAGGAVPAAATGPEVPSIARVLAASGEVAPPTELDQLRRASTIGQARARQLGDRNFLILAGTTLPCLLQTALDSSTPGFVSCLVPQDVYSDNGAVVLLEKGTKVLGEYRASLKAGQARLFVLWTRAVTPHGVAIDLASPASDALGRVGFGGDVDRHFWERFGGALLLSIVDDGVAAAAPRTGSLETLRVPSDAAGIALQHSIDLPPTLKKPQGAEVAIFAVQDFDFSAVYGLKPR